MSNQKKAAMKKIKVLLLTVLLISAGSAFQTINAQEKTKAELENEAKLQQSIDQQKKAMQEQKTDLDKAKQELMDQQDKAYKM